MLLVQKWNDDTKAGPLCPKVEDYEIFFAMQRVESVNNRGKNVYVRDEAGNAMRDSHGHFIVAHDLFNHEKKLKMAWLRHSSNLPGRNA